MTGNTSKWRAPLAGLASIAMLATMGVAASTANAATDWDPVNTAAQDQASTYSVYVYRADQPWQPDTQPIVVSGGYGKKVDLTASADPYKTDSKKVLSYFSYDLAGQHKVSSDYVLTGDVKLFAQYKDAVTVTFDVNNDDKITGNTTDDKTVKIAKGASLTADDYADALGTNSDGTPAEPYSTVYAPLTTPVLVGWSQTFSASFSSSNLYEDGAINADTTFYPVKATAQNVATVAFYDFGESLASGTVKRLTTLNDHPFPAYRLPVHTADKGSWNYDFKTPISAQKNIGSSYISDENVDREVVFTPSDASAQDVTVVFNFQDGGARGVATEKAETTSDQKVAAPSAPAKAGAVFTGWYTVRNANGQSNKYDFDKSVAANFADAKGVVNLYAGWDSTNVSRIQLNLNYKTPGGARIIEYVRPGSTVTLPAGLEDYYQTDAQKDAAKGEYTQSKLTGWKYGSATVTTVKAPEAKVSKSLDAVWSTDATYLLDANGGKFADGSASQWATVADGAAISFPVPTRSGYTFGAWQATEEPINGTAKGLVLNSANGKFYAYNDKFENFFDINSKPAKDSYGNDLTLTAGMHFKALWWNGAVQVTKATYDFNGVLKYENVEKDYAAVEAAGYTKASAKAFVDAQYALRDEYAAYTGLTTGSQAQIDAAVKLNAKYDAAKALLVKSNGADVPAGKVAVYRAFNPNETRGGSHLYTTSEAEYNAVVRAGWKGEGVQFQTTSSKTASPVYRLYNPNDGSHFYTLSEVEYKHTVKAGWKYEGIGWYVAKDASNDVLRIYNPNSGEHVFTLSKAEVNNAVKAGWNDEGVGFKAYPAK